jgi:hypothetical protein
MNKNQVEVRTNNRPRLLLDYDQLTPKEQAQFDYLSEEDRVGRDFIRYRGVAYDLGEFQYVAPESPLHKGMWEGQSADGFSSGVLFKYLRYGNNVDKDHVIMATYFG